LRLTQCCSRDDAVHLLALSLQLREIRELLDQVRLTLRGQRRNDVT
jgi:hypothetical protein